MQPRKRTSANFFLAATSLSTLAAGTLHCSSGGLIASSPDSSASDASRPSTGQDAEAFDGGTPHADDGSSSLDGQTADAQKVIDAGAASDAASGDARAATGAVRVAGNGLLRDGVPWTPHGLNMIAFVAPPSAQAGVFLAAYQHYTTAELSALKSWGADTVRFQVSQPGLDPQNTLFTGAFVDQVHAAVLAARSAGLNVLVSIQDERQSGESTPMQLPNSATIRVWTELAPFFNDDTGILYELMNEPEPTVSAANWESWREAMNAVITAVRATGSTNVVVADGLEYAIHLDGAPALTDPAGAVAYAVHPYFHSAAAETQSTWNQNFGTLAATAPVIVTEWTTVANAATSGSTYFCDSTTAGAALRLMDYLASKKIGITAFAYDFSGNVFGSAAYGFPAQSSSFADDAGCGSVGYGPGTLLQAWFRGGSVPASLE